MHINYNAEGVGTEIFRLAPVLNRAIRVRLWHIDEKLF